MSRKLNRKKRAASKTGNNNKNATRDDRRAA